MKIQQYGTIALMKISKSTIILLLICTALLGIVGVATATGTTAEQDKYTISCAEQHPLKFKWSYLARADDIYTLDLDNDSSIEAYACYYHHNKGYGIINVFSDNGTRILNTYVDTYSKKARYHNAFEDITYIYIDDLDYDGNMDIIASSWLRGTGIYLRVVYGIEREIEPGTEKTYNRRKWVYDMDNPVTCAYATDLNSNGVKDVLLSAMDFNIYQVHYETPKVKHMLSGSVWVVYADKLSKNDTVATIAGTFNGVFVKSSKLNWKYTTNSRIFDIFSANIDGGNHSEIIAASEDTLYVLNMSGNLLWDLEIADLVGVYAEDLNNDTYPDILAVSKSRLHVLDSTGNVMWEIETNCTAISIHADSGNVFIGCNNMIYALEINTNYMKCQDAEKYYSVAFLNYIDENYDDATRYATIARDMYAVVGDVEGYTKSEFIITMSSGNITLPGSSTLQTARDYYSLAKNYSATAGMEDAKEYSGRVKELYENATRYAQMARNIYVGINDSLSGVECDILILEIDEKIVTIKKFEADRYQLYAQDYYLLYNDSENATKYAQMARKIYYDLDDVDSIWVCDSLLEDIKTGQGVRSRRKIADQYYSTAVEYYNTENYVNIDDYKNATRYAQMAKDIYLELNDTEEVPPCDSLIALCEKYITAGEYYTLAQNSFTSEDYGATIKNVRMAKDIYIELNNSGAIAICDSLISQSKAQTDEADEWMVYVSMLAGLGFMVAILIVLVIFMKTRGRSKTEKTDDELKVVIGDVDGKFKGKIG